VRAHDAVDELIYTGLLGLHGERIAMCVRDDPQMLAARTHGLEKFARARKEPDQMAVSMLQRFHVETELAAPMVEAVPVECPLDRVEAPRQPVARLGGSATFELCVARRHELEPEVIVEGEIEQRAVHVDEHRVDAVPFDPRRRRPGDCTILHRTMIQETP
jgi:hypothetical protein